MQSGRSQSTNGYNKFVSQEQRIIRNQSQKVLPQIASATNRNQNSTSNMSLVRQRQLMSSQPNLETHNFGGYTSRELMMQISVDPLEDQLHSVRNQDTYNKASINDFLQPITDTRVIKRLKFDLESPKFSEACKRLAIDTSDIEKKKMSDFEV